MNNIHPHLAEEIEYQEYAAEGAAYHDRREAQMGAEWNNNWQDEFLLTDRDVWVSNPGYQGAKGIHPEMLDEEFEEWSQTQEGEIWQANYDADMLRYYEEMQLYLIHCEEIEQGKYS